MFLRAVVMFQLFLPQALADSLPKKFNTQKMNLQKVSTGKDLNLKAQFKIPQGYKSNSSARLQVYEKQGSGWVNIKTIQEKSLPGFRFNNLIEFENKLMTSHANSELALDLSVNFCKKICVINNFQEIVKRDKKTNNRQISFNLNGFLPHQMIKKEFQK